MRKIRVIISDTKQQETYLLNARDVIENLKYVADVSDCILWHFSTCEGETAPADDGNVYWGLYTVYIEADSQEKILKIKKLLGV